MHSPHRALRTVWTTVPGNSESVITLDSTRRTIDGSTASIGAGSTYLAPGRFRNSWAGAIVRYSVKAATQNVTATEQILTGVAGTSADWETQGSGSTTVTAGTTTVREFKPLAADWRIKIDAGATAPSTLVVHTSVLWAEDAGS